MIWRRLPGSWHLFETTGAVGSGTGVRGSRGLAEAPCPTDEVGGFPTHPPKPFE